MKNNLVKEFLELKKYTTGCIQAINNYCNELAQAVNADIKDFTKQLNKISDRLSVIEDKLGIEKPKDDMPPIVELDEGEEMPDEVVTIKAEGGNNE